MLISYPQRGWLELRATHGEDWLLAPDEVLLFNSIPGCAATDTTLRMPYTVRDVTEVAFWLGEYSIDYPRWGGYQDGVQVDSTLGLYPHQESGVQFLTEYGGGLLCDEMGLGKSRTAAVAAHLQAGDRPTLIIGPKFTRSVWRAELAQLGYLQADESNYIEIAGRDASAATVKLYQQRFHAAKAKGKRVWVFIHFDVLAAWQGIIYGWGFGQVILDEAHYVREGRTTRSKAVAAVMGCAPFRVALTGTPLVNRPSELWHLLTLVRGPGTWGYPGSFRQRYCGAQRDGYGLQDGEPTHIPELQERLQRTYLRRSVNDVGGMVPFSRQALTAELGPQEDAYDLAVSQIDLRMLTEALLSGSIGQNTLVQLGQLRKLTSKAKMPVTVAYVQDLLAAGESVVVFVHERATATALANKIDHPFDAICVVTGELAEEDRAEQVANFQRNAATRPIALVATYGALGVGVTLTAARFVVMHDLEWTFAAMLQAEKRVHRLSSARGAVQSTWVLADQTIDQILAKILLRKAAYLSQILGQEEAAEAAADLNLTDLAGEDRFVADMLAWAATL